MKRTPEATALRTRCAECTRATQPMQLACMCALCAYAQVCADTCTVLFMGIPVQEDVEVQVRQKRRCDRIALEEK